MIMMRYKSEKSSQPTFCMFFDKIDFCTKKYYNDNLVKECKKAQSIVSLICLSFTLLDSLVVMFDGSEK